MLSMNTLIPAVAKDVKIFNIKDYKIQETVELTGLRHKGINLRLTKTLNSIKDKNESASKIISYLMNPCIIYNTDVYGDCILRIEVAADSPLKLLLPSNRQGQLDTILAAIENTYKEKDSKKIPNDLYDWCKKRESAIYGSINKMKEEKRSTKATEKALEHLKDSVNNYGIKRDLPRANIGQAVQLQQQ